jgi:hypothetical protein
MPPRYLRKASTTPLKPCAEFTVETCDTAPADQCCGALPCKLCLEWETYEDGISYGSATFAGSSWTGTVGGVAFVSYWERNYESGECEYIVTLDGEEVYRATCYEGASCRNPAGDVAVSTAYLEGTLRWSKHEPRELALIDNPDTGCRDFFCGDCRCTCECLCVTITEYGGDVITGEICDTAYDCDPPVWAGSVGYYELSIALGRDDYGNCIITVTSDSEEQEPVAVTGCADMSASVTLPNGDLIEVVCKQCACEERPVDGCPCCPGWPLERSANIYFASIEQSVNDCVPIIALQEYSDIFGCLGTALNYNIFQNVGNFLFVRVVCDPETLAWVVEYKSLATGMVANDPDTGSWVEVVFDFVCPDCSDAIDGVAYGSFDFVAVHACETSGGLVSFNVLVHADVEVQCV